MTEQAADSGIEVVLDNRKLIVAFVVLIAICGGFFVLGFVEGKRQGYQAGMQTAVETAALASPDAASAPVSQTADSASDQKIAENVTESQPLNWYQNVNRREEEPEIASRKAPSSPAKKVVEPESKAKAKPESKPRADSNILGTGSVSYTVQVGAFLKQKEAETGSRELRSKGFECRIEPPVPPKEFYLLKVGKFDTRAEAVAMELRLKKSGFSCFVKTN
jgi:cell division protein FtsN